MKHWRRNSLILVALCAAAALAAGPVLRAGEKDDGPGHRSTLRIATVDDEGNRHEDHRLAPLPAERPIGEFACRSRISGESFPSCHSSS